MKKITPTAPVIRFRGFTDVWEQRKLNNVADVRDGTHDSPRYRTEGHPFITSKNIKDGFINYADIQYISDEDFNEINKRSKVEVNDILMGMIGTIGNMALVREKPDYAIKNVALIKDTKKVHYLYLYHFLHSNNVVMQLFSGIDGGTQKFVSLNNIRNLNILFPNLKEQVKLGSFFEKIDYDITLYQRKLEQQKKLKKYFLQNMFPEEGETVPRIRFKGFTGDWEQRKFADLATVRRGLTYKPHNVIEGGKRVLRSSNINENTFQVHNDDVFVDENVVNIPCVNNGDILITSANGSSRLIGKHAIIRDIPENSAVHGGFMLLASSDEPEFVNALMSSLWYTKFINAYVAGGNGAIGNLNKNDLEEQIAYAPQKEEMHKIGDFFGNLDHLITIHQRKIDQLQAMKKFMLQNLFV